MTADFYRVIWRPAGKQTQSWSDYTNKALAIRQARRLLRDGAQFAVVTGKRGQVIWNTGREAR